MIGVRGLCKNDSSQKNAGARLGLSPVCLSSRSESPILIDDSMRLHGAPASFITKKFIVFLVLPYSIHSLQVQRLPLVTPPIAGEISFVSDLCGLLEVC